MKLTLTNNSKEVATTIAGYVGMKLSEQGVASQKSEDITYRWVGVLECQKSDSFAEFCQKRENTFKRYFK